MKYVKMKYIDGNIKLECPSCGSEDVTIVRLNTNHLGIRCWYCERLTSLLDKWFKEFQNNVLVVYSKEEIKKLGNDHFDKNKKCCPQCRCFRMEKKRKYFVCESCGEREKIKDNENYEPSLFDEWFK